jgi:hypothetical protein
VEKELGEALWTWAHDSARDPKRTKRADVLDEVEPRLCWGRSSDSRRVGGHDVGGFVKPSFNGSPTVRERGTVTASCSDAARTAGEEQPLFFLG